MKYKVIKTFLDDTGAIRKVGELYEYNDTLHDVQRERYGLIAKESLAKPSANKTPKKT